MKSTTDIKPIEELLSKYYDGTSTAADQQTLIDFFSNVDKSELPEHMRVDAEIFRQMASLLQEDLKIDSPTDLLPNIKHATVERNRRIWPRIRRYAAVAAAASVVGVIVWLSTDTIGHDNTQSSVNHASNIADEATESHHALPTPDIQLSPLLASAEETSHDVECHQTQSQLPSTFNAKVKPQKSPYREVTNPDEAMAITRRIARLMSKGGTAATQAGKTVDETMTEVVKKITNSNH